MPTIFDQQDGPEAARGRRGGKLNRSETVTVRLDPRLNYLCELAARAQRRTKSSFIEWAVETALNAVSVPGTGNWDASDKSVDDLSRALWDVDEPDRLVALAFHAPILMTHEEQLIWKQIKEHGWLWRGRFFSLTGGEEEEWSWDIKQEFLILDRLREKFDQVKKVALGEAKKDILPGYQKTRKKVEPVRDMRTTFESENYSDNLDDDIPF